MLKIPPLLIILCPALSSKARNISEASLELAEASPVPRVNSCAPTSRGQSKEFHTLEGDYMG